MPTVTQRWLFRIVPENASVRIVRPRLHGAILLIAVMVLAGCTMKKSVLTGKAVDGVVIDATTQQPIPGAMVLLKWRGVLPTSHSNSVPCYHAELATTDAQGRYHTNAWRVETKGHVEWLGYVSPSEPPEPVAYKPGYVMPARYQSDPRRVLLDPFRGTTLDRLEYLTGKFYLYEATCDADIKTPIPIYQAAYEEGGKIAQTPAERKRVETLLVELETAKFGSNVALERKDQRYVQHMQEQERKGSR
jgi:hypothetical protein